jgi:(2Fe-2S) ferredoxin
MPSFQRHVFICVDERADDPAQVGCRSRGAVEVHARLKAELKNHRVLKSIRPNSAGCLDRCDRGVVLVVYPEQVWYERVTVDDVLEIVEQHMVGGRVVERLVSCAPPDIECRRICAIRDESD